jgi:hypothetical protein
MTALELLGCAMSEAHERRWNFWYWLGVAFAAFKTD